MGTTINERFTLLMKALHLNTNSFAKSIDKAYTSVEAICKSRTKPSYDLLESIFTVYPNVSRDWLLMGEGDIFRLPQKPTDGGAFGEQVIADMSKGLEEIRHVFEEELRAKNRQIDNLQELLKMQMAARSFLNGVPFKGRIVDFYPKEEKATA